MLIPRLRVVAGCVTALLVLAGCGDDDPPATDGASNPTTGPSTSTAASPSSAGSTGSTPSTSGGAATTSYVALGDSYTAAPLVPDTDTGDPCLRSSNNYPALVARARPDLVLDDVSCSGADSPAMIGVQRIGSEAVVPQFDALSEDTDVVTVSLGGNDFGLFESLFRQCASSSDALDGQPCTDAVRGGAAEDLPAMLPQVGDRLTSVVAGIKNRSPRATVIVVGYPRLLPDTGTCDEAGVAAGDNPYVSSFISGLNDQLGRAAEAGGVPFVDVYAASAGHDVCSADPWVNGRTTDPAAALAYHPFEVEQQAVAALVAPLLPPA